MSNKIVASPLTTSPINELLPRTLRQLERALDQSLAYECPRCQSHQIVRNGHSPRGRQRYLCQQCKRCYTSHATGKPVFYRQIALQLYLEGLGLRAIGRMLGVSNVTILRWVRHYGQQVPPVENSEKNSLAAWPQILELDELWTFIGSKKNDRTNSATAILEP